jgi:signal transduction histidine kinase
VRVSVIDNGPGIPKDELERIFEKFHQLDSSHTKQHTGTGLGLAICKELARLLHGEIQLVSEVGRGSMFSLILPMSFETAAALAPETRSARDTVTVAQAR